MRGFVFYDDQLPNLAIVAVDYAPNLAIVAVDYAPTLFEIWMHRWSTVTSNF